MSVPPEVAYSRGSGAAPRPFRQWQQPFRSFYRLSGSGDELPSHPADFTGALGDGTEKAGGGRHSAGAAASLRLPALDSLLFGRGQWPSARFFAPKAGMFPEGSMGNGQGGADCSVLSPFEWGV